MFEEHVCEREGKLGFIPILMYYSNLETEVLNRYKLLYCVQPVVVLIGHDDEAMQCCMYSQNLETSYISLTSKGIIYTVVYSTSVACSTTQIYYYQLASIQ